MFERSFIETHLDSVNWWSLETCQTKYAPREELHDLRAAFLNLFSPDPALRKAGHGKLENNIVVQGYLYPASREIMSVLCAAIRPSPMQATAEALDLLFELAAGHEETGDIAALCLEEILSIKSHLVAIADQHQDETSRLAIDILAFHSAEVSSLRELVRREFESGKLVAYEARLREDGVLA